MKTFSDLIDALGGSIALSEALSLPKGTVSAWKSRHSIPAEHWAEIVNLAERYGLKGVSHQLLASMVLGRKRSGQGTSSLDPSDLKPGEAA